MIGSDKYVTLSLLLSKVQMLNILKFYRPFLKTLPYSLDNTSLNFYPIPSDHHDCIIKQVMDEYIKENELEHIKHYETCNDFPNFNVIHNGLSLYFYPICLYHRINTLLSWLFSTTLSLDGFINKSGIKIIYNKPLSLSFS